MSRNILDALMQLFALITLRKKGWTVAGKLSPVSFGAGSARTGPTLADRL